MRYPFKLHVFSGDRHEEVRDLNEGIQVICFQLNMRDISSSNSYAKKTAYYISAYLCSSSGRVLLLPAPGRRADVGPHTHTHPLLSTVRQYD